MSQNHHEDTPPRVTWDKVALAVLTILMSVVGFVVTENLKRNERLVFTQDKLTEKVNEIAIEQAARKDKINSVPEALKAVAQLQVEIKLVNQQLELILKELERLRDVLTKAGFGEGRITITPPREAGKLLIKPK